MPRVLRPHKSAFIYSYIFLCVTFGDAEYADAAQIVKLIPHCNVQPPASWEYIDHVCPHSHAFGVEFRYLQTLGYVGKAMHPRAIRRIQ